MGELVAGVDSASTGAGKEATAGPPSAPPSVTGRGAGYVLLPRRAPPSPGDFLGERYEVLGMLGEGGSGAVLRAFDHLSNAEVAIKLLRPDLAGNPRSTGRLTRELQIARQLRHPNVCTVFDLEEAAGHRFLTMELASRSLANELKRDLAAADGRDERLLSDRAADARMVIAGLRAIHDAGIIHQDIKPENILRLADGRLVVSDFSLAFDPERLAISAYGGTPSYMAPEVVLGGPATKASDIWSLGVVLHEILFWRRPAFEMTPRGRRLQSPRRPGKDPAAGALAALCAECLSDAPDGRPADAGEVDRRFEEALSGSGRLLPRLRWRGRRAKLAVLAVAGLASALALRTWRQRFGWVSPAAAISAARLQSPLDIQGKPADWSDSRVLASMTGEVHCLAALPDGRTARIVWGDPRVAENIDVESGARRPAPLRSETYKDGCPQLSPDGQRLLFDGTDERGRNEVFLSRNPDGSAAEAVTSGYSPLWLPNGSEIAVQVDSRHAGLFSLATMQLTLLPEGQIGPTDTLYEKSVSPQGDRISLRFMDEAPSTTVITYALPGFALVNRFELRAPTSDLSWNEGGSSLRLAVRAQNWLEAEIGLNQARAYWTALVPGLDMRPLVESPRKTRLFVVSEKRSDAWVTDPNGREQQATFDGRSYDPSVSNDGSVVVQTVRTDGAAVISLWRQGDTKPRPISAGPMDATPSFSPDGEHIAFSRFRKTGSSIVQCDLSGTNCKTLVLDTMPSRPVMSPDGKNVVYLALADGTHARVRVASINGNNVRDFGAAFADCSPRWHDPYHLWVQRGTDGKREWTEIPIAAGTTIGRNLPAKSCQDPEPGLSMGWSVHPVPGFSSELMERRR